MGSSEGVTATAGSRLFDDCRAVLQRLGLLRDSEHHASSGGGAAPQDRPLGDSAKDVVAPLRPGQQAGKRDPPPGGSGAAAGAAAAAGPHRDRRLTDQDPTPTGAHPDHQQCGDMQLNCQPHQAHAHAGAAPPALPPPPPLFLPSAAGGGGTPPSSSAFARHAHHAFPPSDAASAPQRAAPSSAAPGPSVAPPATATGGPPPQQRGAQHSRSSSTSTSSWPSGSLGTSMPPPPSPAAAPSPPQPTDASTSSAAAAPPSLGPPSSSSWGSAHAPVSPAYPHSFPGTALAPTHGGAGADTSASSSALARTGSCVGLPLPKPQSHSLGGCPSWGSAHSSHRPSLAGDASSSSSSLGQGQVQHPASAASSDPSLGLPNSLTAAASPAVPGRWPRPSASGCLSSPQQPPPSWPSFGRPGLSPQHGGPPSPAPASARPRRPPAVPPLNLSLLPGSSGGAGAGCGQDGSPAPPRKLQRSWMHGGAGAEDEEDLQAELASYLAPPKWFPKSEGRWYVHKPITSQEVRQYEALVHSLPPAQAVQVAKLLQTLLSAQYSCELMASRGVRIAKDITSEWSRLTGGLLDRIEGYEQCLKKKATTQCSTCSTGMSPGQGAPQARQQAAPGRGSGAAASGNSQQQQPRRTMCGAPSGRLQQPQQLSREELCELYAQLSDAHAETSDALEVARGKYDLAARDVRDLRQDLEDAEAYAWQQQQQLQGQFRQQLAQAQRDASQREARAAAAGAERAERLEKEVAALRAALAEQQGQQQGGGGGGAAVAGGRGKTPASPVALQQQQRLSQQHAGGVAAAAVGAGEVMVELAVSARGRPAGKAC